MVYCVAFGCNSNSCSSENVSFFRFPAAHCFTRPENGKMKCFHYHNYYYYNRTEPSSNPNNSLSSAVSSFLST